MIKKILLSVLLVFSFLSSACSLPSILSTNNKADQKMLKSIESGNYEAVVEAINEGANINRLSGSLNERTDNGNLEKNPFKIACFLGKWKIAKYLIEQGADPNNIDSDGYPILCYVARLGNINLCQSLLQHGAKINLKSENGYTALDCCFLGTSSFNSDRDISTEKMYNFLISNGATLSSHVLDSAMKGYSNDGYCKYNLIQKITMQLISSDQKTDLSPLLESIIVGDLTKFNSLVIGQNNIDSKVLFFASAFGNEEIMQTLFKKGKDINSIDEDGNTLLAIAAKSGNISNIKYLLQKIDLNQSKGVYSPLELAVMNNQLEVAKLLIMNGAKINFSISDSSKTDILSSACVNGNLDMVKLLLENGYPKEGYMQMLQTAAQYNQVQILQYLINEGFDINSTFNEDTALGIASYYGSLDCVKLLVSNGASINGAPNLVTPLAKACYMGQTDVVKFLIEKGVNVNLQPSDLTEQLPLQRAIDSGSLDIVKLLVDHGAKVENSTISLAQSSGSSNILSFLKLNKNPD